MKESEQSGDLVVDGQYEMNDILEGKEITFISNT